MDIYFCDECGARVTDLDLRAGKGMHQRHDTICSGCVDQGLAGAWLARAGQGVAAAAVAGRALGNAPTLAVADPADRIAVARDRARTVPDDPFAVDEPGPQALPKPGAETDAIPASPARRQGAPVDVLAAAGGGFGALVGSGMPPPPPGLVEDPGEDDKGIDVNEPLSSAPAESPFDFVHPKDNDNPGKAETSEVLAVDKHDEAKIGSDVKHTRTPSGRQQSQKRGSSTTSKRNNSVKPASTRRVGAKGMKSNKVIMLSLASCGLMLIVFFGFVLPNAGKGGKKGGAPEQITEEPLRILREKVDEAKNSASKAMQSDDAATVRFAVVTQESMMQAFYVFQKAADKRGWTEENYGEQLRLIGFYEAKSMGVSVRHRAGLLEQRK